jgi:hypothetical protein
MQNSTKVGHTKYQENGLAKRTQKMRNEVDKLRSYTSHNVAYCKSHHKKMWTKGIICVHDALGPIFYPVDKANIIANCLENQFTAHDLC